MDFEPGFKGGPIPTATRAWFYALTNIRIREKADVSSAALGSVIRKGETFEVDAELVVPGVAPSEPPRFNVF